MIEKKYVMGVFLYILILLVGTKKNSHAICPKIVKRTYSLISKNEPDRNWRLRIEENRQKLSKFFEMSNAKCETANLITHFIILHIA